MRMQVQAHAWLELVDPQQNRRSPPLVNRLDDVVGGRFDKGPVPKLDAEDRLDAIRLHCDDASRSGRVVDLAADLLLLDDPADRHHPFWSRDQCVVRLARRALRLLLEAYVEPDRRVEGGVLVDEQRLELGAEGVGLLVAREVAAVATPRDDRVGDARDHVLDAPLALRRGHATAEVLLRDDVRGRLRPELRELDALLLEDRLVLAGDVRVARLPLDLLERIPPRDGEEALDGEARGLVDDDVPGLLGAGFGGLNLSRGRHADPPEKVNRGRPPYRRGPGNLESGSGGLKRRLRRPPSSPPGFPRRPPNP